MVASSTVGIHPAAINVDEVPSFTTIYGFIVVQTTRLVHKYNNEPCINIMIRKTKYNHPSDDRKTHSDLAQKTTEMSRMSMGFVKKLHAMEWLDLRIEKLENVHGPIVKEDV